MKRGTTNPNKKALIVKLKKTKKNIWKRVAELLEKSRRSQCEVNLWKINKYTKAGDTVIVPGKVLSQGELDHDVTIAAFTFSQSARKKIKNALTIDELIKKNPDGKGIKIMR